MRPWIKIIFLICTTLLSSGLSVAATNLPLNVEGADCDVKDAQGRPSYRFTAVWNSGVTETSKPVEFRINVGNACKLGTPDGAPCNSNSDDCMHPCSGTCRVTLRACQFGRGWVQVSSPDKTLVSKRELSATPQLTAATCK
jgi:hypothetical protein